MTVPKSHAVASASFTRPADTTAYASGDLVANSTTAGSVVAMTLSVGTAAGMPARIRRVRFMGDKADATNFNFRVHLFSVLGITCANGDNGAFSVNKAANYLGQVDVATGQLFTDGAMGTATCDIISPAGTVYALIEARAAYTPASAEVFTLMLEVDQD
jgi:hypothetical protein